MTSSSRVAHQEILGVFLKPKMRNLMVSKKKNPLFLRGWDIKNPSLGITVWHHSASLMMPNGDPRDIFFYHTFTLMMDSYIVRLRCDVVLHTRKEPKYYSTKQSTHRRHNIKELLALKGIFRPYLYLS